MTFSTKQLIKIGRLFYGRDDLARKDTFDISKEMICDEEDIYNALSRAREAYRADLAHHRGLMQVYRDRQRVA